MSVILTNGEEYSPLAGDVLLVQEKFIASGTIDLKWYTLVVENMYVPDGIYGHLINYRKNEYNNTTFFFTPEEYHFEMP